VRSSQIDSPAALKFRGEPILRFNDPSRRVVNGSLMLLDATAWRLGETGRPLAIVTLEMYAHDEAMGPAIHLTRPHSPFSNFSDLKM
jgi:hypothetical protein